MRAFRVVSWFAAAGAMFLVAATAVACNAGSTAPNSADGALRDAETAFVAGDYVRSRDLFAEAAAPKAAAEAEDSQRHLAVLGLARSLHQLHDYDAALVSYRQALELSPADSLTWENYLGALTWGGILRGNGPFLESTLEAAATALSLVPDNVELYSHVRVAAAELGRLEDYAAILEAVSLDHPDDPVVLIELAKAQIDAARRSLNAAFAAGDPRTPSLQDAAARLDRNLRTALDEISATALTDASTPPAVYYELAVGYELLAEPARAAVALDLLEQSEWGRRAAVPQRYGQFLDEWTLSFDAPAAQRVAIAERWLPRFAPEWSNDGARYRAVLGMQFDLMVQEVLAAPEDEVAAITAERGEHIATIGRRLARSDMSRGAARFVETANVLSRIPSQRDTALRVVEDGLDALRAGRPGLIYPSAADDQRATLTLRYEAVLMQMQAQILAYLDRDDEAEQVLREAIALRPVAATYAVLGGLLLDQGRDGEAFDLLVAALAQGFMPSEAALEAQTLASALAAAERIGAPPETVDAAVGFAAARLAESLAGEIVANPLNVPAPDFDLAAMEGGRWRLSELMGKVIVLNYWATWCGPCIAEMPYYQQLVDEYRDDEDVVFFAISTDAEPTEVVPRFMDEWNYDFVVLYDEGSAMDFEIRGVPAGFIIGGDGLIKYRTSGFPGPDQYLREMRLRIEALLTEQQR